MVNKFVKWVNKSEFIKNSVTLITGTVLAQIIPILLQPILRRLFDPSDFGLFAIYSTILGIIVSIATLKYENTVMLPKKDEDAANLVVVSMFFALLISILTGGVFFFFGETLIEKFDLSPSIKNWLFVLPISIFLFSSYQAMNYWLIRKKSFRLSSFNKISRRGAEGGVQWVVGNFLPRIGLIVGNISGDAVNFFMGFVQLKRTGFQLRSIKKVKMIALTKRYRDFPLYSALPTLLNTLSLTLPVLIVDNFYGAEVTGFFDLSRMVLALPLALISVSISQVMFQNLSEKIREKQTIWPIIMRTAKLLGTISLVMVLAGYFFSVPVFKLVFGERWELSGQMTQLLILSYAVKFIVSPLSITFNALEKIGMSSAWQLFYFGGILLLLTMKGQKLQDFLLYYMIIDVIAYVAYFLLLFWQVKKYEKSILV